MKKINRVVTAAILLGILSFMILSPSKALSASERGLLLWFLTMLPTLLPYIVISNLLVEFDLISYITTIVYPVLHPIFRVSKNGCYPLVIGLLCGYPMGAKACADLVKAEKITKDEAQYLLSFCNNASPGYIISYVFISSLLVEKLSLGFLLCIYAPILIWGIVWGQLQYFRKNIKSPLLVDITILRKPPVVISYEKIDYSIMNGFSTMVKLGGYMILFSILGEMAASIPYVSKLFSNFFLVFLEITTGTQKIAASALLPHWKMIIILAATNFGGLSCLAQTNSMIKDSGLSIKKYMLSRTAIAALTALYTYLFLLIIS